MTELFESIDAYAQADSDADRERIDAEVWARYGTDGTVCLHDMVGFSRLTEKFGIVHYLSLIKRMRGVVGPMIAQFGGHVVKFEADNTYAWFTDAQSAVSYALAVNKELGVMNADLAEGFGVHISTGIDSGRFLLIDDEDFYGAPVNTASKLAEDIGSGGDILVSKAAMALVPEDAGVTATTETFEISGISIDAYRVTS